MIGMNNQRTTLNCVSLFKKFIQISSWSLSSDLLRRDQTLITLATGCVFSGWQSAFHHPERQRRVLRRLLRGEVRHQVHQMQEGHEQRRRHLQE